MIGVMNYIGDVLQISNNYLIFSGLYIPSWARNYA